MSSHNEQPKLGGNCLGIRGFRANLSPWWTHAGISLLSWAQSKTSRDCRKTTASFLRNLPGTAVLTQSHSQVWAVCKVLDPWGWEQAALRNGLWVTVKGQLVGWWGLKNGSQSLLHPPGHWSSHLEMAGLEVVGPSSWDWPLLDLTMLRMFVEWKKKNPWSFSGFYVWAGPLGCLTHMWVLAISIP